MRHLSIWLIEFVKLVGGRPLYPLNAQCPICGQIVRLHVNKEGRRHAVGHARDLYEGSRFSVHYSSKAKCGGSGKAKQFDPRPRERHRFKLPETLLDE